MAMAAHAALRGQAGGVRDRAQQNRAPEQSEPDSRSYAGFVTRTVAFAIDAALIDLAAFAVATVVVLVFTVLPAGHDVRTVALAAGGVAYVLWAVAYFTCFWTTTGQTPGYRAMRVRLVRVDGSGVGVRASFRRLVGMVIGLPLFIGYVPILLTTRRRALHDAMAGTVIVDTIERKQ